MAAYEFRRRSIAKTVSWRFFAFVDTVLLSLLFTGSIGSALTIGTVEILTKSFLYYLHERLWVAFSGRQDGHRSFDKIPFSQTRLQSGMKALSWRFIGSIDTFMIAFLVTGDILASSSIGIAEVFTKTVLYYLHERAWTRAAWAVEKDVAPMSVIGPGDVWHGTTESRVK